MDNSNAMPYLAELGTLVTALHDTLKDRDAELELIIHDFYIDSMYLTKQLARVLLPDSDYEKYMYLVQEMRRRSSECSGVEIVKSSQIRDELQRFRDCIMNSDPDAISHYLAIRSSFYETEDIIRVATKE